MALGTDNLKKLIGFALSLTEQVATSSKDGWQWTDFFQFVDEAAQVSDVIKSWKDVPAELADLTTEERAELNEWVADEFDIENDKVEKYVEDGLAWAVSTISLIHSFRNKPAA